MRPDKKKNTNISTYKVQKHVSLALLTRLSNMKSLASYKETRYYLFMNFLGKYGNYYSFLIYSRAQNYILFLLKLY